MDIILSTRCGYGFISEPTGKFKFLSFVCRIESASAAENETAIMPELVRDV